MARPFRCQYEGAIYHVTARGNDRRPIFVDDADRQRFVERLRELVAARHVRLYAYALMPNHYHLVVCTPRANLSLFMQQLNTAYTVYFNRRHRRGGHLFEGRFKARLVEGGSYLLSLSRYVHLNPVKTRAARRLSPEERRRLLLAERWSSFRALAGLEPLERTGIDPEVLSAFRAPGREEAQQGYRDYVLAGMEADDEALLEQLSRSSRALGSEAFLREAERRLQAAATRPQRWVDISRRRVEAGPAPEAVAAAVVAACGAPLSERRRGNSEARDVLMTLLREACGLTDREIGRRLGHADGGTVGKRLRAVAADRRLALAVRARCEAAMARIANCKA
jgi:REP element-mobilizing transposase RayT